MAGLGLHFGAALGDRADEVDADRLAHRRHPVGDHGQGGGPRADALDQARHDAAVQQPDRLAQLVAQLDPDPGVVGIVVEPLGADQLVEVGNAARADRRPSAPTLARPRLSFRDPWPRASTRRLRRVGFRAGMELSNDQKAILRLLAQRGAAGYDDLTALLGISAAEVHERAQGGGGPARSRRDPGALDPGRQPEPSRPPRSHRSRRASRPTPSPRRQPKPAPAPAPAPPAAKRRRRAARPTQARAAQRAAAPAPRSPPGVAVVVALIVILAVSGGDDSGDDTTAASGESTPAPKKPSTPAPTRN